VTQREQIQRDLRDSEMRYRALYKKTPVMMQSIDPEGRILSVSEAWLAALGYERSEVIWGPLMRDWLLTCLAYRDRSTGERELPEIHDRAACGRRETEDTEAGSHKRTAAPGIGAPGERDRHERIEGRESDPREQAELPV
jgi:PAS domain-containing protein